MPEERYVYCITCGVWDKAWFRGYANKRKLKQKRWKRLTFKNKIYFGYRLIPCIENRHHIFQTALSKLQLIRKLRKRGCRDGRVAYRVSRRLSHISSPS